MAKITNNHIQLFRNSPVFDNRDAAITKLGQFTADTIQDGTPVLARYNDSGVVKTLLAVFYVSADKSSLHYNIVGDSEDITSAVAALETKLVNSASDGYKDFKAIEDKIVPLNADITTLNADATTEGSVAKKVKDAVDALNATEVSADGQAIVAVSEANGVVSASVGDISAEHVIQDAAVTGEGATDVVTVKTAIDTLRNTVAANKVVAEDASISISKTDNGTALKVALANDEHVLSVDGGLKTTIALAEVTTGLDANTAKAYQLQGFDGAPLGAQIKIPKDSSLNKVYLGAATDTVDPENGTVNSATTDDPQSLNFVYHLENGAYSLTKIDVSKFLTDSEFADGLKVDGGVVKVKVDAASEKFLTVGADGVKLEGVQGAIDTAKSAATTVVDAAGTHISVSESTEADGHKKYTVSDNVNGGNVNLDGYVNTATGNPEATDSVNTAISKLFNSITTNGESAADTTTKLNAAKTAIGLNEDGTHKATSGNYTSNAATIAGEIAALDTQVKANADAITTNKVVAGNGINVAEATGVGTTVSANINTDSGLAINTETKAIEIASIDAGTY